MENHQIRNNKTGEVLNYREDKSTLFLYDTIFGRLILKVLPLRFISKLIGMLLNTKLSIIAINKFITKNKIDMKDYERIQYCSFNDFFIRKIKPGRRPIDQNINAFISPCDAKLMVYKINQNSEFKIKETYYSVYDLINNDLAKEYLGGYALIFRLCVDDYHRYCYLDAGYQEINNYIKGTLHAVRPIVLKHHNIYKRNSREWTVLHTANFNSIIQIEVGALNVGKIVNHYTNYIFKKGEEKGYFKFGASTIVLLVKDETIKIDPKILKNSNNNIETIVKLGEKIGKKAN